MEDLSFYDEGYFWLPSERDNKIPGIIKYNNGKFSLRLFGRFKENQDPFSLENIILGQCNENHQLTLYKSIYYGYWPQPGSIPDPEGMFFSDYDTYYLFVGYHFNEVNDIKFNSISLTFSPINDWMRKKFEGSEEKKFAQLDENTTIKIEYGIGKDRRKENRISRDYPKYIIRSKNYFNLNEIYGKSRILSEFLFFVSDENPSIVELNCYNFDISKTPHISKDVKIYSFRNSLYHGYHKDRDNLFEFCEIEQKYFELLELWFSKRNKLEPIFAHYFTTKFNPDLLLHITFFNYIHALEGYSKVLKRKRESLNERLKRIFNKYEIVSERLFKDEQEKTDFLEQAIKIRNSIVHLNDDYAKKIKDNETISKGISFFDIYIKLCLLDELLMLNDNEMNDKIVNKLVKKAYPIASFIL